jgi:hypothetical protein
MRGFSSPPGAAVKTVPRTSKRAARKTVFLIFFSFLTLLNNISGSEPEINALPAAGGALKTARSQVESDRPAEPVNPGREPCCTGDSLFSPEPYC